MRRLIKIDPAALLHPAAAVIALCALLALVTAIELHAEQRDIEDRRAMARASAADWLRDECIPRRPGERATATMRADGSVECVVMENVGHARAPRLVFAEARE